jgi:linear primary-alkylsulfatase
MGGADAVIEKAQKEYDAVVYPDPKNQKARDLQADAFEEMGYQAESGPRGATSISPARTSSVRVWRKPRHQTPPRPTL